MTRPRLIQIAFLLAAAALLAGAAGLQFALKSRSETYNLAPPEVDEMHPDRALLTVAPGGLRAFAVNYLWIRAQELKDDGKYYDAMQLADLICKLQPRFAGVWGFHAWNMAWNISVATHTPEERWLWVYNGVKLLRDEGIPRNPESVMLYKDLSWIFFSKMGGFTDQMHLYYKRHWAGQMQRLLGAPPVGGWQEAVAALRPVAEAPLNRDRKRRGDVMIQPAARAELLADPAVRAYADLLAEQGVGIGQSLLDVYNRYSMDHAAAVARPKYGRPDLPTERDEALFELINSSEHADARARLLAFVRAQILWNRYKMDPGLMVRIMEEQQAPIDWRLVWPHGLYWARAGTEIARHQGPEADWFLLDTARTMLNCMRYLTWYGRLTVVNNPADPDAPEIHWVADWRFIEPTHQATLDYARQIMEREGHQQVADTPLRSGHMNYLVTAIQMLVAEGRIAQARRYYDFIRDELHYTDNEWQLDDVREFALARLRKDYGAPILQLADSQITGALMAGYVALSRGDLERGRERIAYARTVYDIYQDSALERYRMAPFQAKAATILVDLLQDPRRVGYSISLVGRSRMYHALGGIGMGQALVLAYDVVAPALREQTEAEGLDFEKAFPPPPGLQRYRRQREEYFRQVTPQEAPRGRS